MTHDPIETLTAANPLRDTAPTAAEAARMDDELHRLLALAAAGEPAVQRHRSRSHAFARRLALPAIAVAATVVALAAPDRAPHPLRPAPATAATVLAQLGGKVAQAPAPAGRYAYVKQLSYVSHMRPKPHGKGTFVVVLPHTDEQWVTADGTAISRNRIAWDQPTFPTAEDKADYEAAGTSMPPYNDAPHRVEGVTVAGFTPAEVLALPTDPAALRGRLTNPDVQLTGMVGQLLGSALTPPPVKVALFEVLKGLPGATLVPDTKDPLGRTGVGVQFETDAWKTLFLFDPATGALLGTRAIGHKEVPGRDIDDWSLVLESRRVDDAPAATGRTLTIPVA